MRISRKNVAGAAPPDQRIDGRCREMESKLMDERSREERVADAGE
jgi:hypothetical protein